MLYELRYYLPKEGKAEALSARFRDYVFPIMKRHGLRVHDFWQSDAGTGELWYVMAWKDEAESVELWANFRGDPEWKAARQKTEVDGLLIEHSTSVMLRRVPYFDQRPAP